MYVLNIDKETNRILSAWVVLEDMDYGDMPRVDTLPENGVSNYLWIDGEYVYDPLPEPVEPEPTGEAITADEMASAIMEGVNAV